MDSWGCGIQKYILSGAGGFGEFIDELENKCHDAVTYVSFTKGFRCRYSMKAAVQCKICNLNRGGRITGGIFIIENEQRRTGQRNSGNDCIGIRIHKNMGGMGTAVNRFFFEESVNYSIAAGII